jgi:phage N-6-adenine-methyltransferase
MELHQKPRSAASLSDKYETPPELFLNLCEQYGISPELDVCAEEENKKCERYYTEYENGLLQPWSFDAWCNPPHSQNKAFVIKAFGEWRKNNINIMMILPTNTMSSKYFEECIEGSAEYHPIFGRIKFLIDGSVSKFPSRNAYICVVWRKRS